MFYLRFTQDIFSDMETQHSYTNQGHKLGGICAFSIRAGNLHEYSTKDEILEAARQDAQLYARAYSYAELNDGQYAVVRGEYTGSNNDGVLINVIDVISYNENI